MGTPSTGSRVWLAQTPARCAAPARGGDDHLEPAGLGARAEGQHLVRSAVGRGHVGLEGDLQGLQGAGGFLHGGPVGLGAHEDADGGERWSWSMALRSPHDSGQQERAKIPAWPRTRSQAPERPCGSLVAGGGAAG